MKRIILLLIVTPVSLAGCRQSSPPVPSFSPAGIVSNPAGIVRTYDQPVPALPSAGKVRIVPQKIQEDANTVHWKWTIVGDRNWSGTTGGNGGGFDGELTDPYPLNATNQGGGTNVYEYEATITANNDAKGGTDLRYSYSLKQVGTTLSGAINSQVRDGGVRGAGLLRRGLKKVTANQAAKSLVTTEQELTLPLDLPVLEVKGQDENGKAFRQLSHLKAAK